jgi:hypothetical protein
VINPFCATYRVIVEGEERDRDTLGDAMRHGFIAYFEIKENETNSRKNNV